MVGERLRLVPQRMANDPGCGSRASDPQGTSEEGRQARLTRPSKIHFHLIWRSNLSQTIAFALLLGGILLITHFRNGTQRRFQDSFPQCARRTLERRRCPAHGRSARSQGTKNLPYVGEETCLTPRASPRRGDGTFAVGRGSRGDRTLARSRIGRNHPDLFGRRPVLERTGSVQDQTHQGQGWALSAG